MGTLRKPFQGVLNIIWFNCHFYIFSLATILSLLQLIIYLPDVVFLKLALLIFTFITFISLAASCYIYDFSGLYGKFFKTEIKDSSTILNINAGFDETSTILNDLYKNCRIIPLDFYNPSKHTEISIKRARRTYPPYPGTVQIETSDIPLAQNSADIIFVFLAAHEIRNAKERILFFRELERIIKPSGSILVTEHLRDIPNFLAYTVGFLHFYSASLWHRTFREAGLVIRAQGKHTPFITTFILNKEDGTSF